MKPRKWVKAIGMALNVLFSPAVCCIMMIVFQAASSYVPAPSLEYAIEVSVLRLMVVVTCTGLALSKVLTVLFKKD